MPPITRPAHRSNTTIYHAISVGLFPLGVSIGKRAKGWPSDEVEAINAARVAGMFEDQIRELVKNIHKRRITVADALCADAMGASLNATPVRGEHGKC